MSVMGWCWSLMATVTHHRPPVPVCASSVLPVSKGDAEAGYRTSPVVRQFALES
jgi:hypothetical protein